MTSVKPLIKFFILFFYINSVILYPLILTLIGSRVTYHLDFLSFALQGKLPHLFPFCQEWHRDPLRDVYCSIFFINDLIAKIPFSKFLFFADLKIFHITKSAENCKILQSDIGSVQKWCIGNYVKIDIFKRSMISFTRETSRVHFNYFIGDLLIS